MKIIAVLLLLFLFFGCINYTPPQNGNVNTPDSVVVPNNDSGPPPFPDDEYDQSGQNDGPPPLPV